jgi:16S rRNA (guanine966-N2)-methyltransferase
MSGRLRVIGGTARGRALKSLPGRAIRPTPAAVRKSLFQIIDDRIRGASCLDLYSGTGLLGIEALSRGAEHATFVEAEANHCRVIRENLEQLGLLERAAVVRGEVRVVLQRRGVAGAPFQVVLADPPYQSEEGALVLAELGKGRLLAEGAVVVLEHGRSLETPALAGCLSRVREGLHGDTCLAYYRKE